MIERPIEFGRLRLMKCGACEHQWRVTGEWLDSFDQGLEVCPSCGIDCTDELRPDFWAASDDPACDDSEVHSFSWYHSTTHEEWPNPQLDPAGQLTEVTRQRMESMIGVGAVTRWANTQKTKALHLGTYEAAIENMLRRMRSQGDASDQFYLYRVLLRGDCEIEPGVSKEPTNFVGDAHLADYCAPGVNVLRYVNVHEDPSSVSLAIDSSAIESVQRIPIPLPLDQRDARVAAAASRLEHAATIPTPPPRTRLEELGRHRPSALALEARSLEKKIAELLPLPVRHRFEFVFDEGRDRADLSAFASRLFSLARLVTEPGAVLNALDTQTWRAL